MRPVQSLFLLLAITCGGCTSLGRGGNSETPSTGVPKNELSQHSQLPQVSSASCHAHIAENESANPCLHHLYINKNGQLKSPQEDKAIIENEEAYIGQILENFKKEYARNANLRLTIYVHGGLNSFKSATSRVSSEVINKMLRDDQYPLFVSWNSGGPTNYYDHLLLLRRGVLDPKESGMKLGPIFSPLILIEDLTRSVVRMPTAFYNAIITHNPVNAYFATENDFFITDEEKSATKALEALIESKEFRLPESVQNQPSSNDGLKFAVGDFITRPNPSKFLTAGLMDGLGTGTWGSILRRADLVLSKDEGNENGSSTPEQPAVANPKTAVSKFLDEWQDLYGIEYKHGDSKPVPVILIGHSAGTIITNQIVARYQYIKFSDIVYMGAACRIKDLTHFIAPYLERNRDTKFYNLSLHPHLDISENYFYDFLPRGSLLLWIDEFLGNVNSFQDRTAGYWNNIVRGADQAFPSKVRAQVYLTRFGINEKYSPQKHGAFDECDFWRKEFWEGKSQPKNDETKLMPLCS